MRVREAEDEDIPRVAWLHVRIWEEVYRGILADEFLNDITVKKRGEQWRDFISRPGSHNLFVAEKENEIVGFVSCGPARCEELGEEFPGELYTIYVKSSHWREGIGEALFRRAERHLEQAGLFPFYLWVLAELEGSRDFYESMGGEIIRERKAEIGGREHRDLAFGWK